MKTASDELRVACVQLTSGTEPEGNRQLIAPALEQAVAEGAEWIVLPEAVNLLQRDNQKARAVALTEEEDPVLQHCRDFAAAQGCWVHIGSLILRGETESDRLLNRGFVIDHKGEVRARYDKIHLFDVVLSAEERYRESASYQEGDQAICVQTPWGGYGLSICYDVRFPHLYRSLSQTGARILSVPAAFTRPTGKAHWLTLLRARAIETGSFVLAAAQCGDHPDGRSTYGHSLVVSPWGEVLAQAGAEPTVLHASLSLAEVERCRQAIPAWQHNPPYRVTSL